MHNGINDETKKLMLTLGWFIIVTCIAVAVCQMSSVEWLKQLKHREIRCATSIYNMVIADRRAPMQSTTV